MTVLRCTDTLSQQALRLSLNLVVTLEGPTPILASRLQTVPRKEVMGWKEEREKKHHVHIDYHSWTP